ncbi:MAG: RHS repeat-associated core domain-containing protein [Acidobacteriota bacterium]
MVSSVSGTMGTQSYDSNRVASLQSPNGSESYVYAPDNRRIWRSGGAFCPNGLTFYSPSGQKLGTYSFAIHDDLYTRALACEENIYFGSRLAAKATGASPSLSSFTTDRLHSKGNGSQFFPYGESRSSSPGDDRENFATYSRDSLSGLDYADQRYYAPSLGRFLTVDPNLFNANRNRSSSVNAYAYTEGDPVNSLDSSGLVADGCGTWWASARDFGRCDGGGGGTTADGCSMTRVGCIDIGNGGGALIRCVITDPTSSFFGSVSFCVSRSGDEYGEPIGGSPVKEPECEMTLSYRGLQMLGSFTNHAYITFRSLDESNTIGYSGWVYEGFVELSTGFLMADTTGHTIKSYLAANSNVRHNTIFTVAGLDTCKFRVYLDRAVRLINKSEIKSSPFGPNSNSAARFLVDSIPNSDSWRFHELGAILLNSLMPFWSSALVPLE